VFDKKKIHSLRMGGLLAVNLGSINPPTFNIMEWKPAKTKNSRALVLVGKGVVYDTGGLSLKSTPNGMDDEERHGRWRSGCCSHVCGCKTSFAFACGWVGTCD
jgi:hypothetical protein